MEKSLICMSRGTVNEDSQWMHKMKVISLESPQLIQANVCNLENKLWNFFKIKNHPKLFVVKLSNRWCISNQTDFSFHLRKIKWGVLVIRLCVIHHHDLLRKGNYTPFILMALKIWCEMWPTWYVPWLERD